jgi:hypothetical protein
VTKLVTNPTLRFDVASGLVVIEFHNDTGAVTTSIPTLRQLEAYRVWGQPTPGYAPSKHASPGQSSPGQSLLGPSSPGRSSPGHASAGQASSSQPVSGQSLPVHATPAQAALAGGVHVLASGKV